MVFLEILIPRPGVGKVGIRPSVQLAWGKGLGKGRKWVTERGCHRSSIRPTNI